MVVSLTASSGRSIAMRPDISSGDQRPSRMSPATRERLSGSSMSLRRLQRAFLPSALRWAVEAR